MASLSQFDLRARSAELQVRALLEDLLDYLKGVLPRQELALVAWFGKEASFESDKHLLALYARSGFSGFNVNEPIPLLWKSGNPGPPFVHIDYASVALFEKTLATQPQELDKYFKRPEVIFFDKRALPESILRAFNIVSEPNGLIKGWYLSETLYKSAMEGKYSLLSLQQARPSMGIVKVFESPDSEDCRALFHVEVNQMWVPVSFGALGTYSFYNDLPRHAGYFLLQGGALYQIRKVEVKTCPEYSERVLEKLPDDRYPEIYLRAVHEPSKSTA